jgi:hypothetical protein
MTFVKKLIKISQKHVRLYDQVKFAFELGAVSIFFKPVLLH